MINVTITTNNASDWREIIGSIVGDSKHTMAFDHFNRKAIGTMTQTDYNDCKAYLTTNMPADYVLIVADYEMIKVGYDIDANDNEYITINA